MQGTESECDRNELDDAYQVFIDGIKYRKDGFPKQIYKVEAAGDDSTHVVDRKWECLLGEKGCLTFVSLMNVTVRFCKTEHPGELEVDFVKDICMSQEYYERFKEEFWETTSKEIHSSEEEKKKDEGSV